MYKKMSVITIIMGLLFSALYLRIFVIMSNDDYLQAGQSQGTYTINSGFSNANIYDCNFKLLNNRTYKFLTVINPTADAVKEITSQVKDKDNFYSKLSYGKPFVIETNTNIFKSDDITSFAVPIRTSSSQLAQNILGYVSEGEGVGGLEQSYNDYLRSIESKNSVTYRVDAKNNVLSGEEKVVNKGELIKAGLVTTIDSDIQEICESAMSETEKGAVVVMDINTGQIKAMVSYPTYNVDSLELALKSEDSPFINRALCGYNVGSVFKLVTAISALQDGVREDFEYECTGSTEINGQVFKCHNTNGHGLQNMEQAMVNSCNTYFIELSKHLSSETLIQTAASLGFGREFVLADAIISSSGNLQSIEDLKIPAEKANICFGQGKLLATPLQVTMMTSAIANGGKFMSPKLVLGTTDNGEALDKFKNKEEQFDGMQVIPEDIAEKIQEFMVATVQENENSYARPINTTAAGKTSTAQTGKYNDKNIELCHAWVTGYFPIDNPKYAITVMIEDGGSGNTVASPIFKKIAENITSLNEAQK